MVFCWDTCYGVDVLLYWSALHPIYSYWLAKRWALVVVQAYQWDRRDHPHSGRHAGKSVCQCDWSHRQYNKFLKKSHKQKYLFFSRLKGDLCLNFCVFHKKRNCLENISFLKTRHRYVIIKGIIGKKNCYWHMCFFSNLNVIIS